MIFGLTPVATICHHFVAAEMRKSRMSHNSELHRKLEAYAIYFLGSRVGKFLSMSIAKESDGSQGIATSNRIHVEAEQEQLNILKIIALRLE